MAASSPPPASAPKTFMNEPLPAAKRASVDDTLPKRDDGSRPRDPENPERPAEEPEEWKRSVGPSSDDGPSGVAQISDRPRPGTPDSRVKHQNFRRPG